MTDSSSTSINIPELIQDIQKAVVAATRASNSIPISEFTYFNSFDSFSKVIQHEQKSLINMLSDAMKPHQGNKRSIEKLGDIEDKFDLLCDVNDIMLDRVGHLLDDAAGLKKKNEELIVATLSLTKNEPSFATKTTASWNDVPKKNQDRVYNLYTAKGILRPQLKFKDKIDNRNAPFVPIIKEKPNSIKPLAILREITETGDECFSHPYEVEIDRFEPSEDMLQFSSYNIKTITETPLHMVTSFVALQDLVMKLKCCKEFAVDLEHHSYRTFQGFTCLMQISTTEEDFIVDTLELRSDLHILNEVFTDPKIVKVFHGADMDIQWLQRDFGIYVVNMFDTGQAARVLNFAHFSLAYLLKHFCNLNVNKQFQLADWRMRPLPDEMIQYAREDTHYLLYIYDQMKKQLLSDGNESKNLLKSVFYRSKQVCLKRYEKPMMSEKGYQALLNKCKTAVNARQCYALRELWIWRDKIARIEDESIGYVLPNHMLLQIALVLPREQQGILACCNPVPPLVKQQLNELHSIILKAREVPLDKENVDIVLETPNQNTRKLVDLDNCLFSKEDMFEIPEKDSRLNALLETGKGDEIDYDSLLSKMKTPQKKAFSLADFFTHQVKTLSSTPLDEFVTPYERYKQAIEQRRKLEEEAETARNALQQKGVEEVQAHFEKLVSSSFESPATEEKVEEEMEVSPLPEDKPLRDLLPKTKKKKPTCDIPCNPVASAIYNLQQKASSSSQQNNEGSVSSETQFDYKNYDYSKFSSKNSSSKQIYDPDAKLRQALRKGDTKVKVKRKTGKSFTFGSSKKSKR